VELRGFEPLHDNALIWENVRSEVREMTQRHAEWPADTPAGWRRQLPSPERPRSFQARLPGLDGGHIHGLLWSHSRIETFQL